MGDNIAVSTVAFTSNLQPIRGSFVEDKHFLSSIHDPFALEAMDKAGYEMITKIQRSEYRNASLHCIYAYEDDYPWGTIIKNDGSQRVVCKCTNVNCIRFSHCRPDFDDSELDAERENIKYRTYIKDSRDDVKGEQKFKSEPIKNGDTEAASDILDNGIHPIENMPAVTEPEQKKIPATEMGEVEERIVKTSEFTSEPVSPQASFESFEEVIQTDIITSNVAERIVVNAGPGTGKTWTLIEKIKYMLSDVDVDPENILVLCFSRAAVEVVRNRLEKAADRDALPLNWHEIDVRTFDSFATYLLAWAQENEPDMMPQDFSLELSNYDERIVAATSVITEFTDLLAEYRHVIVDEVQDLVGVRAEMVLAMLKNLPETCGFTILGDSCQSLYDYLAVNDKSVMDSAQFYQNVFQTFRLASYYSLSHNYRQGNEFGTLTVPYRKAILTGDAESRTVAARNLSSTLSTSSVNLKQITAEDTKRLCKSGSLGILTRTNGQALQISSWLRAQGIEHILQKPLNSQSLASWIGQMLMNTETDMIDFNEFRELFSTRYPLKAGSEERYWRALISTQTDETKRHFEIEDLLRGLLQNARNPLLYEEPTEKLTQITVSNIHRAKGREFDSVLVLNDVLEAMADDETDDILEHKVCYVALTRPKKRLEKVELKNSYIYISKDAIRRCFKAGGRPGHKYLSHFEVGDISDINERSFAVDSTTQGYIQSLPKDTRLMFIRCPEGTKSYVVYRIVPEEDEHRTLGYTTSDFARNIERSVQRIYKHNKRIAYSYYPEIFSDIYLNGLITCISASDIDIGGAKKIGNMNMWFGLEISGFAHRESTRY